MRLFALPAAALLGACTAASPPSVSGIAGANNAAALDAAVECRTDAALIIAQGAENTPNPPERLFALLTQAALLTEMGDRRAASGIVQTITDDPALNPRTEANPDGRSRDEIAAGVASLGDTIRQKRAEVSGSPSC